MKTIEQRIKSLVKFNKIIELLSLDDLNEKTHRAIFALLISSFPSTIDYSYRKDELVTPFTSASVYSIFGSFVSHKLTTEKQLKTLAETKHFDAKLFQTYCICRNNFVVENKDLFVGNLTDNVITFMNEKVRSFGRKYNCENTTHELFAGWEAGTSRSFDERISMVRDNVRKFCDEQIEKHYVKKVKKTISEYEQELLKTLEIIEKDSCVGLTSDKQTIRSFIKNYLTE